MSFQSVFFYESHLRLQLFFSSPNHCATFLGMFGLLLAATATSLWKSGRSAALWFLIATLTVAIGMALLGIAFTYSRGGWISFASGLVILGLSLNHGKRVPFLCFACFLAMVIVLPHGPRRACSILNVREDRSISNRLVVWKGAMAMATDHWCTGVGLGQFGQVLHSLVSAIGNEDSLPSCP